MACVRVWEARQLEEHSAEFGTTVQGLLALRDWLEALGVMHVAMDGDRCVLAAGVGDLGGPV